MHGFARGHVDGRRAHVEPGVSHHLGRDVGVLAAQVGQQHLLPGANASRDRLADRPCSDNDNDFAHGEVLTRACRGMTNSILHACPLQTYCTRSGRAKNDSTVFVSRRGQCSRMTPERSAILRGIEGHSVGDSAEQAIALRTARLILTPLSPLDEAEHARASGNSDDALRDTRAAELQWREHGFGPWAIRDLGDNSFLGAAELRFAGDGIEGIAPDEVEAGWWVRENRRNQRIATEAMRVAIGDLWSRGGVENVTAYIEEGENEPSRRLAASLGFTMRSQGRGRFGEPMTVYELLRDVWDRRGG